MERSDVCFSVSDLASRSNGRPAAAVLAFGAVGGFVLGVVARAWMRVIADDPEFTWNGSLFIVLGFTVFGISQALGTVVNRDRSRRWQLFAGRLVGILGMAPLFVAAGAIMLPTVVGAGLALDRPHWHRSVRIGCCVIALVPIGAVTYGIVDDFGWSLHAVAGFVLLLALYAVIIRIARPTLTRLASSPPLSRRLRIAIVAGAAVLIAVPLIGGGIA